MVFKRLMMSFIFLAACAAEGLSAQSESGSAFKGSDVPIPPKMITIRVVPAETPHFQIDDTTYTNYTHKKDPKSPLEWLAFDIMFETNESPKQKWPAWLEDVEVTVEVFVPGLDEKGKVDYVMLQGKQVLNPVRADNRMHSVRFFIPPYNINRYILLQKTNEKGKNSNMELKKLAKGMPVCVSFKYKTMTVYAVQAFDKAFWDTKIPSEWKQSLDITNPVQSTQKLFALLRKMRKGSFFYLENAILPGEYTPWASIDWDKFESMKQAPQGGK